MEHPSPHLSPGARKTDPAHKIGVAAIAKDEAAYIADWVHHNLYFGFDCSNVWINGTSDQTAEILQRISAVYPQVHWENADELMARSMSGAGMFQHLAYDGLLRWGEREGCSHVLFIDIDEMWTPRDFRSPIGAFVAQNPTADVISFPWFLDVPDVTLAPFTSTFRPHQSLSPNNHVKSLIRLGGRITKMMTHTAKIEGGRRLLVDRDFDMADESAQAHGSKLSAEQFRSISQQMPEAFVMHWIYRSQLEYVAILGKGMAQAGSPLPIKRNRDGYLPRWTAGTKFDIALEAAENYHDSRLRFLAECGIEALIESAESAVIAEAARVNEYITTVTQVADATDPELHDIVSKAMEGVDQQILGDALRHHMR